MVFFTENKKLLLNNSILLVGREWHILQIEYMLELLEKLCPAFWKNYL